MFGEVLFSNPSQFAWERWFSLVMCWDDNNDRDWQGCKQQNPKHPEATGTNSYIGIQNTPFLLLILLYMLTMAHCFACVLCKRCIGGLAKGHISDTIFGSVDPSTR